MKPFEFPNKIQFDRSSQVEFGNDKNKGGSQQSTVVPLPSASSICHFHT